MCLSIINDIIKFVAEYQGVSVCPPLMNPVKHDFFENHKVHHSPAGVHRLFALHHQFNKKVLFHLIEDPTIRADELSVQANIQRSPQENQFGPHIPRNDEFFNAHYIKRPLLENKCT